MSIDTAPHLGRYELNPTVVALSYRWATLLVGLLVALLAIARPGSERAVLLAPVGVSLLVTTLSLSRRRARWLPAALAVETLVASAALWVTGSHTSPLMLYLTAPLVHAALLPGNRLLAGLVLLAVLGYVIPVAPDSTLWRPGDIIGTIALLTLLPLLVRFTAIATTPPNAILPLDLEADDMAIARHLVHGRTYREIADALSVSQETVKVSVSRLYRRIGARNRDEAVTVINELRLLEAGLDGEE